MAVKDLIGEVSAQAKKIAEGAVVMAKEIVESTKEIAVLAPGAAVEVKRKTEEFIKVHKDDVSLESLKGYGSKILNLHNEIDNILARNLIEQGPEAVVAALPGNFRRKTSAQKMASRVLPETTKKFKAASRLRALDRAKKLISAQFAVAGFKKQEAIAFYELALTRKPSVAPEVLALIIDKFLESARLFRKAALLSLADEFHHRKEVSTKVPAFLLDNRKKFKLTPKEVRELKGLQ